VHGWCNRIFPAHHIVMEVTRPERPFELVGGKAPTELAEYRIGFRGARPSKRDDARNLIEVAVLPIAVDRTGRPAPGTGRRGAETDLFRDHICVKGSDERKS